MYIYVYICIDVGHEIYEKGIVAMLDDGCYIDSEGEKKKAWRYRKESSFLNDSEEAPRHVRCNVHIYLEFVLYLHMIDRDLHICSCILIAFSPPSDMNSINQGIVIFFP